MSNYTAWALEKKFDWGTALLGRGCWPSEYLFGTIPARLFRTRQDARDAKKTCCYEDAKVVKVNVKIRVIA